jgi:4-hydroxy-tetrahydrodipicolinate synthase
MPQKDLVAFPITPMDASGRVDTEALQRLVVRLVAGEVDGVCVLGSTGSYPFLSRQERRRAIVAASDRIAGAVPLSAGIGALRTDDAVQLARDAAAAGVATGLLAAVSYTPLTENEVYAHYATVAREGGLPICIYDNPASTHFTISESLLERLSAIPNVVAVKRPALAGDEAQGCVDNLRSRLPAGVSLGFSVDMNAAEALIAGGDAWYSVLAGLFPKPVVALTRAISMGNVAEARRLNGALQPMWTLFRDFTGLRVIYAAANLLGICRAEPPRPILALAPPALDRVAATISELGDLLGAPA